MRIGVLTTSFPRFEGDIAGHFVLGSCNALIARGHSVDVLAPEPRDQIPHDAHAIDVPELRVIHVPYLRPRDLQRTFYGAGVPDNLRVDRLAWLGLAPFSIALTAASIAHAQHWDALISHWALPCGLIAALRPRRCRHLSVLHSADVHVLRRLPARAAIASRILHSADQLWFSHERLRDDFSACLRTRDRHVLRDKSTCHAMGIDAPLTIDRDAARKQLQLSRFTVLVLSRLVPVKGIERAIDAVVDLPVDLVIAGDGPERQRLQQRATELGVRARFVGVVSGADKSAWLTAADVLLLPSIVLPSGRTEGVPTAAIEAMSHGCAVIASDVGGIAALITHGHTGWLVDPSDPEAIAACLRARIADRDGVVRVAEQARVVARSYRWPNVIERWEAALQGNRR